METTKGVIRIIKLASTPTEYDEYYYLSSIGFDNNGSLIAQRTSNILNAMMFKYDTLFKSENDKITALVNFVKTCYIPKRVYKIEFIPVKFTY